MASLTPIPTGDGSSTFYSETFGEWFHSREGARNEAQKTYVEASQLVRRARTISESNKHLSADANHAQQALKILDVCYGLGYNTAAALEAIWTVVPDCPVVIKALEIDIEVPRSAIAQNLLHNYSVKVQQILKVLSEQQSVEQPGCIVQLLLGDARQHIQQIIEASWQADVVFLDPFSPPHCPQLWTVEFLQQVAQCLHPEGGALVTYSCAAAVRTALMQCGLSIGDISAGGRKWPGTIASYDAVGLPSSSQQAQEHLQTRAAVPYRDPSLRDAAEEILARRAKEQASSELMPTAPWRRRWKEISTESSEIE